MKWNSVSQTHVFLVITFLGFHTELCSSGNTCIPWNAAFLVYIDMGISLCIPVLPLNGKCIDSGIKLISSSIKLNAFNQIVHTFTAYSWIGESLDLPVHFYAPGLKVPPGASSNRIVCLSIHNSAPLANKVQFSKFGWSCSNQTWTVSSSKGCSHLTDVSCPWGMGRGQNLGLREFAIVWHCCRWGHPCFTNTCLVVNWIWKVIPTYGLMLSVCLHPSIWPQHFVNICVQILEFALRSVHTSPSLEVSC